MAMNRFGALRTIATAVRTATRPESPGVGERLMSLPRLFAATFRGDYAGTTRGRLSQGPPKPRNEPVGTVLV